MTFSQILHQALGCPTPEKYKTSSVSGHCATCGAAFESAVHRNEIAGDRFTNHADYLRGEYVCIACASLYADSQLGNILAIGQTAYKPLISLESAAKENRPTWRGLLLEAATLDPNMPVVGILTTDTKPRLFPKLRAASVTKFGLYIHAPDYDVSQYISFDLTTALEILSLIETALNLDFSKKTVYSSLLADYTRAEKSLDQVLILEKKLSAFRQNAAFIPALLIAQKTEVSHGNTQAPRTARTKSGSHRQEDAGLF